MVENKGEYYNKTFDAPDSDVSFLGYFKKRKHYGLTPLEHRILSRSETGPQEWAKRFLLISLGLLFTIVSKVIVFFIYFETSNSTEKSELTTNIEYWEWISLGIGLSIGLGCWFYSKSNYYKSERKNLIQKINNYYDTD